MLSFKLVNRAASDWMVGAGEGVNSGIAEVEAAAPVGSWRWANDIEILRRATFFGG